MTTSFLGITDYVAPKSHHTGTVHKVRAFRKSHPDLVFTSKEMAVLAKIDPDQAVSAIRNLVQSGELHADKSERVHRYSWRRG